MAIKGGAIKRSGILLVKTETTPGTDAVSVVGTNAIVAREVTHDPLGDSQSFQRDVVTVGDAHLGVQTQVTGMRSSTMSIKPDVAGGSAAGTAPDYGPL